MIGGRYHGNSSAAFDALASLPAPAPQVFDGEDDIQVANTAAVDDDCGGGTCLTAEENDVAARCAGTPEDPTAPAGVVCIYPTQRLNAEFLVGFNIVNGSNGNTPSPGVFGSGFGLGWEATGDDDDDLDSAVLAVWAYTAP